MSDNVAAYWRQMSEQAALHARGCALDLAPVALGSGVADYATLTLEGLDGTPIQARCVFPRGSAPAPVVLAFHDATRPVRGWHHLTRYVALGCAVVALQNRAGVEGVLVAEGPSVGDGWGVVYRMADSELPSTMRTLDSSTQAAVEATYVDALVVAHALRRIERVDTTRIVTVGDGLGGALALLVASQLPVLAAAAMAPLPSALDPSCANSDIAHIARDVACPVLVGMGLLDLQAPPAAVDAVVEGLANARTLRYPRYAHERVNAFEDELMAFLIAALAAGRDC